MAVKPKDKIPGAIEEKIQRTIRNGLLACECTACQTMVYIVESNAGPLRCPHCSQDTLKRWGIVSVLEFHPEIPGPGPGANGVKKNGE